MAIEKKTLTGKKVSASIPARKTTKAKVKTAKPAATKVIAAMKIWS